ncbi:DEAD/DEAH box helicase [Lampropedia puyangensis]|uniref:DEAD-box ATP-dependent RNA helicase RhpA n=1 Tax=Lampropedia puyangensis TaxID=1330072 RepID=A0A4S8F130_9BURK|nr:DEAD/DEAH box helicase [Lampropedia puyangensis]THT98791.1 DEAD/DEAH box helicase [Lampropedia puyangensis]
MSKQFSTLMLAEPIQRAIADMGYQEMTPIQEQAIPVVLAGQDVMGAAQTGTGKTAAFSLPLLQRMLKHENSSASPARHPVRALVLLPTRELADQVADQVAQFAKHTKLRSAVVFGGMDMKPQVAELKSGVEVLVATPGRLLDHLEAKSVSLAQVEYVVLDEADRMLDIGFLPDLQRILSHLPAKRTTLLFSATFSPEIKRLAESYLQNPVLIEVARPNATNASIEQQFFRVGEDDKRRALLQLFNTHGRKQAFVFVNSRLGCSRLARSLERDGVRTAALHGDKSQDERLKALDAFKAGEVDLLICTDVAARGLDIKDVPAVVNFDVPFHAEDYVHRIGRTGRGGASGLAFTLVTGAEDRQLAEIGKLIGKKITAETLQLQGASGREAREDRKERSDRVERGSDRRESRDGRGDSRERRESNRDRGFAERDRRESTDRSLSYRRASHAPKDPLFDAPYVPSTSDATASWEVTAKPVAAQSAHRRSGNIKPKAKIAALLRAAD